jgi:hypothetical protein
VTGERTTYEAAITFIKRYGGAAAAEAAMRADMLGTESDLEGRRIWMQVAAAIMQLQRAREPGEAVN